ncbi:MAG TPA: 4Fe-4S binding protein [bacterium]|nr:4Fe-4S binding protein [bacterium]
MGEIGYSKIFLTPEFGPRQRFAFIITDAPLQPDPIYEEPKICDRCMLCVKECPSGAISRKETVEVKVAEKTLEWGSLDELKCAACYQAGTPEYSPFMPEKVAKTLEGIFKYQSGSESKGMTDYTGDVWAYLREEFPYIRNAWESYHHPANICGAKGCIRACMIHLEQEGKLKNKFKQEFRKHQPWVIKRK